MKKEMRNAFMLIGLASMPLWFASCSDEENIPAPGTEDPTNPEIEAAFDFKMTTDLPVEIDYPSFAQICVYDQIPDETNNARLLFRSLTGANGKLETVTTFPTAYIGKTVYVVANGYNCPPVQEATLTENGLEIKAEATRAVTSSNSPYSTSDIDELWAGVLKALPENGDNLEYVQDNYTSGVNIDTHISGLNNEYPTAQIQVTFVNMVADNYNTLYYYTYTDETKSQISDSWIKSQIKDENKVFGPYSSSVNDRNNIHPNQNRNYTVTICDETGKPREFENGEYIGFILVSKTRQNSNDYDFFYTSEESTRNRVGQSASFSYQRKALVYTFEDQPVYTNWPWGGTRYNKSDFNDFCFVVTANPVEAIDNPDIPDLPTPPFYLESRQQPYEGTLLFEDNYPEAGDYDMNDFVATYSITPVTSVLYYPDTKTEVEPYYLSKVEYEFTPKWDGAWYGCSFSFMLDGLSETPTHVYDLASNQNMEALTVDPIEGTIDLGFTSEGKNTTGSTFEAKDYPMGKVFNPFIVTNEKGYEIHLPDYKASSSAKLDGLTDWQKAYKLEDGLHPYAANIPTQDYQIVTEQMKIDNFYPKYIDWVNSKGESNTDWYLYPAQ